MIKKADKKAAKAIRNLHPLANIRHGSDPMECAIAEAMQPERKAAEGLKTTASRLLDCVEDVCGDKLSASAFREEREDMDRAIATYDAAGKDCTCFPTGNNSNCPLHGYGEDEDATGKETA